MQKFFYEEINEWRLSKTHHLLKSTIQIGWPILKYLRVVANFLTYTGFIMVEGIDGLVQERRNSSALAIELRLSCINPSVWVCKTQNVQKHSLPGEIGDCPGCKKTPDWLAAAW